MSTTETVVVVGAVAVIGLLIMANMKTPQGGDAPAYEALIVPPCPTAGYATGGCPTCTGQCGGNCGRH